MCCVVACCLHFVVCGLLFVVCGLLFVGCYVWFCVFLFCLFFCGVMLFVVCCVLRVAGLLFVVDGCLLVVGCWLLIVVLGFVGGWLCRVLCCMFSVLLFVVCCS